MTARRGRPTLLPVPSATGSARYPDAAARKAACSAVTEPDLFFDDSTADVARGVCAACPVIEQCLAHALLHEGYGVWGGTTAAERDRIRGFDLPHSPEDRRYADSIRERIDRGLPQEELAVTEGIHSRTLNRWLLDNRQPKQSADAA